MFEASPLRLHGAFSFTIGEFRDERGGFTKYLSAAVREIIPDFQVKEVFTTFSSERVLRGLHFQLPPRPQAKLVSVLSGSVFEVVVDLRRGSPTYSQCCQFEMASPQVSNGRASGVYVPVGFAHGYIVLEDNTQVLYLADSDFESSLDAGISWDSVDVAWPLANPILSQKDRSLPTIQDFKSPFSFTEES